MRKLVKQLSKKIYLSLISVLSKPRMKKRNHIVFLLSFPSTSDFILESLYEKYGKRLVICYTNSGTKLAKSFQQRGCSVYCIDNPTQISQAIFKMKSTKIVLCDNYFALLASFNFDKETRVVQLWHANGAIKKFGLEAKYAKKATKADQKRYQSVYNKFTHFVVSSETMMEIFSNSYNISPSLLPFGYPITDFYFDDRSRRDAIEKKRKIFGEKIKIALYVPTYRETITQCPLNFKQLEKDLGPDWRVIVHPHPHDLLLKKQLKETSMSSSELIEENIRGALFVADCLITDYSSVPFEYSLANPEGKIIYFCYDLQSYNDSVGIQAGFEKWANPIVRNQAELLKEIKNKTENHFTSFNNKWNAFVSGEAMSQLKDWIDKQYEN